MRMSKLIGKTLKESPRGVEIASHKLLLRAAYVRMFSAGVYGLLPLAVRSLQKIEAIIRDEMNEVEGQEVRLPCLMTKELWDETGRYSDIDDAMFRFNDRSGQPVLLGMTHEEAVVHMARTEISSYKQLPAMLYQIQTKFRDEPRARGGLIRLREFTMKDAYSFHTNEKDLKEYYDRVHKAYETIFKRSGCKDFVSVLSDNGMFGGKYSHEFMLLTESGEDTLITCSSCDYKANQEIAQTKLKHKSLELAELQKKATPGQKTISDLATFLNISEEETSKAVLFENDKKELIATFVRGDRDVVEAKLSSLLQESLQPASHDTITQAGAFPGSTGPVGLDLNKTKLVLDLSVLGAKATVIGANEEDQHFVNFNFKRDFLSKLSPEDKAKVKIADIIECKSGDVCPNCESTLTESRGIEIGNIFHLGDRYSKSMKWSYLDESGKGKNPIMGCYGLGVSRLLAALIEEHNDSWGMTLPLPVAPYEVHLIALNYHKDETVKEQADLLYKNMKKAGIEVLFDDRKAKAGPQFADADLIGIPFRLTLSGKSVAADSVEFKYRDKRAEMELIPLQEVLGKVETVLKAEYELYR